MAVKKKQYIENLRIISMLSVILIHICITALSDFPDSGTELWRIVYQAVRNVLHFAVPCFFMISGALILPPEKSISFDKLIKKYVLKYAAVIVVFGWGFAFIEEIFKRKTITPGMFWVSFLNMLQGKTWNHMWYMYSLLGVMLILPLLKAATSVLDDKMQKYIMTVCFIFLSIVPYLCKLTGSEAGTKLALGSVYAAYMLVGYWIDKHPKKMTPVYLTVLLIGVVLMTVEAVFTVSYGKELYFSDYSSPVVFIFSAAAFALARSVDKPNQGTSETVTKLKTLLSVNSFGVYLVHMFWINLAYKFIKWDPLAALPLVNMVVIWAIVTVLSVVSTMVLRKIPGFKAIL